MPVSSVKALERPCMRIMSPLFTVAMVSVCAEAEPIRASEIAPTKRGVSFIEFLPRRCEFLLSSWANVHHLSKSVKRGIFAQMQILGGSGEKQRGSCFVGDETIGEAPGHGGANGGGLAPAHGEGDDEA